MRAVMRCRGVYGDLQPDAGPDDQDQDGHGARERAVHGLARTG